MKKFLFFCVLFFAITAFMQAETTIIRLVTGKSHIGEFDVFRPGDALVVIAQSYPDLSHFKA